MEKQNCEGVGNRSQPVGLTRPGVGLLKGNISGCGKWNFSDGWGEMPSGFKDSSFPRESVRKRKGLPGCFDLAICKTKVGLREGRKGKKNPQFGGLCGFFFFFNFLKIAFLTTGAQELVNKSCQQQ